MPDCPITLDELLASRDRRREMQRRLLAMYPGKALIVLTVIMPGSGKQSRPAAVVAGAARQELTHAFAGRTAMCLTRDLRTGFEMYMCVDMDIDKAKKISVGIEESHPLGRLMDIDVIGHDGIPVSRGTQRPCLLCGKPARQCMRERNHTSQQLTDYINQLTDEYFLRT